MRNRPENLAIGASLPWPEILDKLPFNTNGLSAAIAQQVDSDETLMLIWMSRAASLGTLSNGQICYRSRPRQRLWRKGEISRHPQTLKVLRIDCHGEHVAVIREPQPNSELLFS
jgi:phosphoribosyl-AMP cyclohydrolase